MKAIGNTLNRNQIASLGHLWEILKTTSWIVTAIAVGLALGQLHQLRLSNDSVDCCQQSSASLNMPNGLGFFNPLSFSINLPVKIATDMVALKIRNASYIVVGLQS